MDFSKENKDTLTSIAEHLEIEVEAKKEGKPTRDELIAALEEFEKEFPDEFVSEMETFGLPEKELEEVKKPSKNVFTYVGGGETSPHRINFMGLQEFVKGRAVEVTNPKILAKLVGNPTFVQGEVDQETIQSIEDEGAAVAQKNRAIDDKMDTAFKSKHSGGKE